MNKGLSATFETCFCAGPGREIYTVGASGAKGSDGSEEKLYCQVRTDAPCKYDVLGDVFVEW